MGRKLPTDFGLFDMYGNVAEWCQDAAFVYPPRPDGGPVQDLGGGPGVRGAQSRVVRGGSFDSEALSVPSAQRDIARPSEARATVGFRVARTCD